MPERTAGRARLDVPAFNAYNAGMQYTLRNVPKQVDRLLRERARREGKSLNEVVLEALARVLGLEGVPTVHRNLRDIAGTWTRDKDTESALDDQRRIDRDLWR